MRKIRNLSTVVLLVLTATTQASPLPTLMPVPPQFIGQGGTFVQSGNGGTQFVYVRDNMTGGPIQYVAGQATPPSGDFLLTGDVTPNVLTEMGFLARGNIVSGSTYYLAIDATNNYFNLVKIVNTSGINNLNCQPAGITYSVGTTYKLSFIVSGTNPVTLTGSLYLADGTFVKTLSYVDSGTVGGVPFAAGSFGTWAFLHNSVPIEGHWANLNVSAVPGTVSGTVVLDGYVGDYTKVMATFQFRPTGGGVNVTRIIPLNADGTFSLKDIPVGTYNLAIRCPYFLQVVRNSVSVSTSDLPLGTVTLLGGDANGDNVVTFEDFSALQNNYGQSGKTGAEGDFNGDGSVSFEDFSIMQNNYGQSGAAGAGPLAAAATGGCASLGIVLLTCLGAASLALGLRKNQ